MAYVYSAKVANGSGYVLSAEPMAEEAVSEIAEPVPVQNENIAFESPAVIISALVLIAVVAFIIIRVSKKSA